MNIGPAAGLTGSAAGAPLSQTSGNAAERAAQDAAAQRRSTDSLQKAEDAAGIGQTEEDREAGDRDADGRRDWEGPAGEGARSPEEADQDRKAKDVTGDCGNELDLTG